jgi:hypothetical protein
MPSICSCHVTLPRSRQSITRSSCIPNRLQVQIITATVTWSASCQNFLITCHESCPTVGLADCCEPTLVIASQKAVCLMFPERMRATVIHIGARIMLASWAVCRKTGPNTALLHANVYLKKSPSVVICSLCGKGFCYYAACILVTPTPHIHSYSHFLLLPLEHRAAINLIL